MKNYLDLLSRVLDEGEVRENRTADTTKVLDGETLKWNLQDGFPMITTRKMPLRIAFEETMMFLRGQTDTRILSDKNIHIWEGNTTREFLDSRGLTDLPVGSLGTGYSHQWRNFGGDVNTNTGVDQIVEMLHNMKENPYDRRHLVTAWNPQQLGGTPLPPCHIMHMYTITPYKKLHSSFVMRSNDVYHGLPFNIMSYALLNHIFSEYLGLNPGTLTYFGWNVHVYESQEEVARMQLDREPKQRPFLKINKPINTIDDIMSLEYSDISLLGYDPYPPLPKVNMVI